MNYFKQYAIPALFSVVITMSALAVGYYKMPIGFLEPKNDTVGATITTINGSDTISSSRSVINSNFANLNASKIETSTTSLPLITTLSGLTTASSLNTIGTIISGVWHGSIIPALYGGTGQSSFTANSILLGNGSSALTNTDTGTDGQQLTYSSSSKPFWSNPGINQTLAYSWSGSHSFSSTTNISAPLNISGTTTFTGTNYGLSRFIYGDGSDGVVTISATTTLSRDMYYSTLTVNSGVSLNTGGYKIFVSDTLTNNGFIANNGTNGAAGTAGNGAASGTLRGGANGGAGGAVNSGLGGGGGGGGGFVVISARIIVNNGTISANGGNGGNGSGNALAASAPGSNGSSIDYGYGGSGGQGGTSPNELTRTATTTVTASKQNIIIPSIAFSSGYDPILNKIVGGGAGGSGGNSGQNTNDGGGGGGGGGLLVIFYDTATFNIEQAIGGTGGSGVGSGTSGFNGLPGIVKKIKI